MICKHDRLARQCNECDLEKEVVALKAIAAELAEALRRTQGCDDSCRDCDALAKWEAVR